MKFFPLIVLIVISAIAFSIVLVISFQTNLIESDNIHESQKILQEGDLEIQSCPDSVTKMRTIFHCGAITVKNDFEIITTKGMKKCMLDNREYYTMQSGQDASITYEIYRGSDYNDPPQSPAQVQIIKDPQFLHQHGTPGGNSIRESYHPQGIHVAFDSDKTLLGYDESAVITALVSVEESVDEKTMLLGLTPFSCNGGTHIPFAIVK